MIRSITFGKESNYYLGEHKYRYVPIDEEEAKKPGFVPRTRGRSANMKSIENGYACVLARECLLGKTFTFNSDRINLIFGPNASGKSTILKTIAEYCLCGEDSTCSDGWTNPMKYRTDLISWITSEEEMKDDYLPELKEAIGEHMNNATVDWDGSPVYNDNFLSRNANQFGDLQGSMMRDTKEELLWHYGKSRISAGQKTIMLLEKLFRIVKDETTMEKLLEKYRGGLRGDIRKTLEFKAHEDYIRSHMTDNEDSGQNTFLFDEIDNHLDISNVLSLYCEVLPSVVKKRAGQIIMVTHTPLILLKGIYENDVYNIISLNPEYTEQCRELIKKLT